MCDVSVIIPVYNIKAKDLMQCVDSVINQECVDIEIIIVDDGSKAEYAKLCDDFKEKDNRIDVIHQANQGVSVARNEGMRRAGGKWIAFVDGDDWLEPNMLSVLVKYGNKNDADIVLCDCFINYSRTQIEAIFFQEKELNLINFSKDRFILQFLCSRIFNDGNSTADSGAPWAKLYRRSFIQEKNIYFDKNLRRMQDNIFNLYAYEYANSIFYIHMSLYHYRKSLNSGFYSYNPNIADIYNMVFEKISDYIVSFNKDELFIDALNYKIFYSIYVILNIDILNKNNPNKFRYKRRKLFSIINSPYYEKAIREMEIRYLSKIEKVFFFLVKNKLFLGMCFAVYAKKVIYRITGKGVGK